MEIKLKEISIQDVVRGYRDSSENGVVGYDGKLNIRPAFQREFIYDDKKRNAVIDTVIKGFPLNVMYWVDSGDGNYELLDGQQRTISICQYVDGVFSLNNRAFHNLTPSEQNEILNYKLMIYICKGTDKEKLAWFKIINIAGVQLTAQELRNAIYTGPWLHDAKRYFSRSNSPAYGLASKYLTGEANRQAYLETALEWICEKEGMKDVEEYMSLHQHDSNAAPLWTYFTNVINWVKIIFPKERKEMKGLPWGILYNHHKDDALDPQKLEEKIQKLIKDDDVTKRSGIYEYLLTGKEKCLQIRAFTDNQKAKAYEKQQGICPMCKAEHFPQIHYELSEMEADHIIPWCDGGKTIDENLQMLCRRHNNDKRNR